MSEYRAICQGIVRSRSLRALQLDCLEALEFAIRHDINMIILAAQQCTDNNLQRLCLNYRDIFKFGLKQLLNLRQAVTKLILSQPQRVHTIVSAVPRGGPTESIPILIDFI